MFSKLFLVFMFFSNAAFGSNKIIQLGCLSQDRSCYKDEVGNHKCIWASYIGNIVDLELNGTTSDANSTTWKGTYQGIALNEYPYTVSITQYEDEVSLRTSIKIETKIGEIIVSSFGQDFSFQQTLLSYNKGVGVRCTTDLVPPQ